MNTTVVNPEKIIERLKIYNYKYELDGQILKVILPMFCYLKLDFRSDKFKITSHINFGFPSLPLELNFILYGLSLYILTWYFWTTLNKAFFLLLGLVIIYHVVCFIKIETMKIIIHNWIESDNK